MRNISIFYKIFWVVIFLCFSPHIIYGEGSKTPLQISLQLSQEKKIEYLNQLTQDLHNKPDSIYQQLIVFKSFIKEDEKELQIKLQNALASYYWRKGKIDTAILLFKQNLDTSKKYKLDVRYLNAMANLGAILNFSGMPDSAYYCLKTALPLAEKANDSSLIPKINFDLGNYYLRKTYNHLALEHLRKALDYYESDTNSVLLIYAYNSLGNVYTNLKEFNKAKYYYLEGIKMDSARDDVQILYDLFNNLGVTYWKVNGQLDSARYYVKLAVQLATELSIPMNQLIYQLNLGGIEIDAGNLERSLKILKAAEQIELPYIDKYKLSALYINMGAVYIKLGKYGSALYYNSKGIRMAQEVDAYDNLLNAYGGLSELDTLMGHYKMALQHYKMMNSYKDSIDNKEIRNKIAELEIIHETKQKGKENQLLQDQNLLQSEIIKKQIILNYSVTSGLIVVLILVIVLYSNSRKLKRAKNETEKKNKEISEKNELIYEKNKDLEAQKEELFILNQTKDKFFTIIAHDLRNPFSGLLGLLDILETDFHDLGDDDKLEIISKLNKNGRNTYNMLVNLLDWARTQRGRIEPVIESVNLNQLIKSSISFLSQRIQDKEHLVLVKLEENILLQTDPNLLQTIIVNILNNALKFTKRGGEIIIEAEYHQNSVVLSIKDNGVGMDQNQLKQLFSISTNISSKGTENERGTGLGLILSKEFVQLLKGSIRAESEVGKGSTFVIDLPLVHA